MLCDKLLLNRIAANDYDIYIQEAATDKWQTQLDKALLNKIFSLTECHAFYLNLLCNELWKSDQAPIINDVSAAWHTCYDVEKRRLMSEIGKLTINQQKVIKALAVNPTQQPSSQQFLSQVELSISSVRLALRTLIERDVIYQISQEDSRLPAVRAGQYRLIDPLLAYMLRQYQ